MHSQNPHEKVLSLMKSTTPSMRYDGKEDFAAWQKRARQKLEELLGLPQMVKCPPELTVEYEEKTDTYTEIRFRFQSEEGYFVPCHLRIPAGASDALPVMICLQGHSTGMHISLGKPKYPNDEQTISGGDRDFANRIIAEGYCALALEQRDMGGMRRQ